MIKIFRHIRRSLLSEGKTSKYFKYAIGEIVLVVIGILIALQINNWNEANKSRAREQFYLKSLLGDMKNNLDEINGDILGNEMLIKACDSLLLLANYKNYMAVDDTEIGRLIISLGNYSKVKLEQGTITEIITSGSLQTIRNEDIRSYIVDWERNFIEIKELETFARHYQEKYLGQLDTFLPYYKFDYIDIKYPEDIRDQYFSHLELLNNVGNIRFVAGWLNENYLQKIQEIEALIKSIERELE